MQCVVGNTARQNFTQAPLSALMSNKEKKLSITTLQRILWYSIESVGRVGSLESLCVTLAHGYYCILRTGNDML